jgi:tetratricopeptide (TPR) repeat protein
MPQPSEPLELFYSYSHKDEELRDQLENHLAMLKRDGVISGWHDRRISVGQEWDGKINKHLNSAEIILLLISSDFLASNYCYDIEVKRAMERHEEHEARVIPIILRPCDWHSAPFGKVQALPKDAKPVTRWSDRDEAFLDIATGIRIAAKEVNSTQLAANSDETTKPAPHLNIPDILRVAFVARKDRDGKDIVQRLTEELAPHKNRLIALWGAGGVGKTAIAAEAARALVDDYNKRVMWVSAEGREDFNLAFLLDEIATQLGKQALRKLSLEMRREQVRELLVVAPALVVLDNFETIAPEEGIHCAEWLAQPALCSSLITTRQNIRTAHRNIPTDTMLLDEADALLDRSIAEAHDLDAFTYLNRASVIQASEANPLVLQWIVRQIDLAQDAGEVLDDLKHGEGTAAERVFERSFNLKQLDDGGRAVLLALALFVPNATRKALAEVAGFNKEKNRKRFKDAIKTLASLWLLHTADSGERLAVEGLTRELTRTWLLRDARSRAFRQRYVMRFTRLSKANAQTTAITINELEREKDNLLNAMSLASEIHDWESVVSVASILTSSESMLGVRGYWDEAISWAARGVIAAKEMKNDQAVAMLTINIAGISKLRGEYSEARQMFLQTLTLYRERKDTENVAGMLFNLGLVATEQGDLLEAQAFNDECLTIYVATKNQKGRALALMLSGLIAVALANWEEARKLYLESLQIFSKAKLQLRVAECLGSLGKIAFLEGDMKEARRLHNECLKISQIYRDQSLIAGSLRNLGLLEQEEGNFVKARELFNDNLEIEKTLGNGGGIATTLHSLGRLSLIEQDYRGAEKLLTESLADLKRLGIKPEVSECLETIGGLKAAQDSLAEAQDIYGESLKLAQIVGDKFRIASVTRSLGLLAERENHKGRAAQLLRESLSSLLEIGSREAKDARRDLERVEGQTS